MPSNTPMTAAQILAKCDALFDAANAMPVEHATPRLVEAAEAYRAARAASPVTLEEANAEEAARLKILEWRGIGPDEKVCVKCGGAGVRVYGSTSTWHGGYGGQQMTSDICDRCWGSGCEDRPWLNLRNNARRLAGEGGGE